MKRFKDFGLVVAGAALIGSATGCDAIFGDGYDVRIEMNNDSYVAWDSTDFIMFVENESDNVVYYLCGGEVYLEHLQDGDLVETRPALPNCDCLCPSPIEPGASERREFRLDPETIQWMAEAAYGSEDTGGRLSAPADDEDVEFRYRLKLYEDTEFEHELDLDDQRSTRFTVTIPQTE